MSPAPEFRYTLDESYLDTVHARWLQSLPRSKRAWRRVREFGLWLWFLGAA